ncbi:MAG TPA: class II fructose-bisphosphatase [Candidatus Methylacidiphilales bacterium]|nr:class II fructose-bisphosphatase [Candidatus Methylacidiphilales bacterium]
MKRRLDQEAYYDIERVIEFDFVRATEAGALNSFHWLGRGEKELGDGAACDAIRGMFDIMYICGEVVIGEGIKDNAPGIFKGEHLGQWLPNAPKFDIALDPVDGTTNLAKGLPNSISVIAAASPEPGIDVALQDIPAFYMTKLAYGPKVKLHAQKTGIDCLRLNDPIDESLTYIARVLRKRLQDLIVCVLDRPRHKQLVEKIRELGCSLRMISDGDISAAIAPSLPDSGIDVYIGIGGSPEAVLAAAAIKCLGGEIQAQMWPRDDEEKNQLIADGYGDALSKVYYSDDLAKGKNIIFCATGISDSPLVPGIKHFGHTATTHSILMRARHKTVRYIRTHHNLSEKTIRLRSSKKEHFL